MTILIITPGGQYSGLRTAGTIGDDDENVPDRAQFWALAGDDTIRGSVDQFAPYVVLGSGDDSFTAPTYPGFVVTLVSGAQGSDSIAGSNRDGILQGGSGDDSLTGGDGSDGLYGDGRDDVLDFSGWYLPAAAAEGRDTIAGGAGDDLIAGGRLADSLDGGPGSDTFVWESPEEFGDTITGFQTGAGGDRLFFNGLIATAPGTARTDYVQFAQLGADTLVRIDRDGAGAAHGWQDVATLRDVTASEIADGQLTGLVAGQSSQVPTLFLVVASEWADVIARSFGPGSGGFTDTLPVYLLGGDDVVTSETGGQFVLGDGDDRFTALPHPVFSGTPLAGTTPAALAIGGRGADSLAGVEANDTLAGGSGGDVLDGAAGDDFLFGDGLDVQLTIADAAPQSAPAVAGNDTITGGAGRDLIVGGGGADRLDGGAGSDLFAWEAAADFGDAIAGFEGGASGDRLFFGDLIEPREGLSFGQYVWLRNDGGTWTLWLDPDGDGPGGGPAAAAQVAAFDGAATAPTVAFAQLPGFVAGPGSLTTAVERTGVLLDPLAAEIGTYWADEWNVAFDPFATSYASSYHLLDGDDVVAADADVAGSFELGRGNDRFSVVEPPGHFGGPGFIGFDVSGDEGDDTIAGSSSDDALTGGSGSDSIVAGDGNDTIYGDLYDSTLAFSGRTALLADGGGASPGPALVQGGADTIVAGDGDDLIVGGEGADDLDGGAGTDLFVYERVADFGDTIRGFEPGLAPLPDRILVNGLIRLQPGAASAADYVAKAAGGGGTELWIDLDASGSAFAPQLLATLVGVLPAAVDVATVVLLGEEFRGDGSGSGGGNAIEGTEGPDTLVDGSAGGSALSGLGGGDTLTGGAGDDTISGGDGIDVAVYAGGRASYQLSLAVPAAADTVQALVGDEGTDRLDSVERLWFADRKLAIDFGPAGHAEVTAKILGAVFGPSAVGNAQFAGIGIGLLDSGLTYESLMQLALQVALGPNFGNQAMVALLLQNLGFPAEPALVEQFSGLVGTAFPTQVSLAMAAADLQETLGTIDLAGLRQTGLAYES